MYRAASFQFYPDDFVAGTSDLTTEEVGAYVLLMCKSWNKGGVPTDVNQLARICRLSPARMRRAWVTLRLKFSDSPHQADLLSNDRLEQVREDARQYAEASSERGKKGASARWQRNAKALPKHDVSNAKAMLADSPPSPTPSPGIAAAANSPDINSRARVGPPVDRSAESPAWRFATWFLARGIECELIGAHHGLDPALWALRQLDASESLITAYGEPECCIRAERMFSARRAGKLKGVVSVVRLAAAWDFDELKNPPESRPQSDYMARQGRKFPAA